MRLISVNCALSFRPNCLNAKLLDALRIVYTLPLNYHERSHSKDVTSIFSIV